MFSTTIVLYLFNCCGLRYLRPQLLPVARGCGLSKLLMRPVEQRPTLGSSQLCRGPVLAIRRCRGPVLANARGLCQPAARNLGPCVVRGGQ